MIKKLLTLVVVMMSSVLISFAQKDITSQYITNPNLSDGLNGWTSNNFNTPQKGNNTVGYASECYAGWDRLSISEYSLKQTITLPKGNYRLVNYSFFRYGLSYNTDPSKSLCNLVAGSNKVAIKTLGSITAEGYANSQAEGANCFDSKMYRSYVDFSVENDNTAVPIGLEGTFDLRQSWCIAGCFELLDMDEDASEENAVNYTYLITNPGFEYRNASGWTITGDAGAYAKGDAFTPKAGIGFAEKWTWVASADYTGTCYQTITVPAGKYTIKAYAQNIQQQNSNVAGAGMYLVANDDQIAIGTAGQYSVTTTVTTGSLNLGIKCENATGNWISYDRFELYYLGVDLKDLRTALQARVDVAKSMLNETMKQSYLDALNTAITNYDGKAESLLSKKALDAATAEVNTAISNAQANIDNLAEIEELMNAASSLDENGQNTYEASSICQMLKTMYDEKSDEKVTDAQKDEVTAALKTAALAQTTPGSDMTLAITNPEVTKNADGWTTTATGGNLPFVHGQMFEYWSDNTANSFDFYQDLLGVSAGVYTVSAEMSYTQGTPGANEVGVYGSGATEGDGGVTVLNGTYEEVTSAEFVSVGGKLRLGVKNFSTKNGYWFVARNFKLTFVRALTDEELESYSVEVAKGELLDVMMSKGEGPKANIGDEAFQYNKDEASAYNAAYAAAEKAYNSNSATEEEILDAKENLENQDYPTLNDADPSVDYKLFMYSNGYAADHYIVTLTNDRADQGGYNIRLIADNADLQTFNFTPFGDGDGTGMYNISCIDADGAQRYISTAVNYGGNVYQIRTTTDPDAALAIRVVPTDHEGVFQLQNADANYTTIGCQDAAAPFGIYTTTQNTGFTFSVYTPTVTSCTIGESGWAATSFSENVYIGSLYDGYEAYIVSEVDNDSKVVTLRKAMGTVEAGTALIIKGEPGKCVAAISPEKPDNQGTNLLEVYDFDTQADEGSLLFGTNDDGEPVFNAVEEGGAAVPAGEAVIMKGNLDAPAVGTYTIKIENATALQQAAVAADAPAKRFENGMIIIEKGGKKYNAAGAQMK